MTGWSLFWSTIVEIRLEVVGIPDMLTRRFTMQEPEAGTP